MIARFSVAMLVLVGSARADVLLSDNEIAQTLAFGPWPPQATPDPSNRVSGDTKAIALGRALFDDPVLSVDGAMSCATCHDPQTAFASRQTRAMGREILARNTPALFNLRGLRWYGWGGDSDSLWAASLLPLISDVEMGHSAESLKNAVRESAHAPDYQTVFGDLLNQSPQTVLVNIAKVLAAYQETLATPRTSFDDFRDALERGDLEDAGQFPQAAQRGLQLFLGQGNCSFCHTGPSFSNNEFHDAGVPYFLSDTEVDPGRFDGLKALLTSPYTLAGDWSDDPERRGKWVSQNVRQSHADFGTFRTPSLRGVAATAPYMHDGSIADLDGVVRHYNDINLERMHADGEAILRPLELDEQQISDLVSFLETLGAIKPFK
ncbi:cytochrome-c peroxidase [Marivita geojedonensis]|uniref:Cytochrome c domain-containing protein n=1 Tax=Marivita geojedonensis TaxID=1123756 RepID=A0A1X4NL39_9RHOB|nr:cytochrome c peroxidase [Marivita geojedonensis]OSQ50917.1 hypothetical protein MGEO_10820 [Marivita geojedonensis]PRY77383.1 cytochrome c peroxidase [Marivita geojedonensis]